MSDDPNKKPAAYSLPYSLVVEYENSIRQKIDFWRLRTIAVVLRQPPDAIKSFSDRYKDSLN
jgi:hypothetical protein